MLSIIIGVLCGLLEYMMLTRLSRALLGGGTGEALAWLAGKIALLAAALALVYLLDYSHILWAGAGIGITMAVLAAAGAVIGRLRSGTEGKAGV